MPPCCRRAPQFRPVNCSTRQALSSSGGAYSGGVLGGATSAVHLGQPQPGWGLTSWKLNWRAWQHARARARVAPRRDTNRRSR